jgi:hypothetical protein
MHISFAAMAHLAEGLCINTLLTMKVENSVICIVRGGNEAQLMKIA